MSDDIVQRLRSKTPNMTAGRTAMEEAADRIEELEADLAKALEALHSIDVYGSDTLSGPSDGLANAKWLWDGVLEMRNRASAAIAELTGGKDE